MSKVIHNPALAAVEETGANSASFVIEPLQAGYGNTLGNSLRRVLLSSVKGGAIVAFRTLEIEQEDDWEWEYECLVEEIIETARSTFPSLEPCDGWRGREDRILLRNATGWVFSEIEICRIMGWSDTRMMLRYASLRGSDLASRLA